MKKIIILSLCVVLIAIAMLLVYQPNDFIAGKGNGINQKIKNTEELSVVINDVCDTLNSINEQNASAVSYSSDESSDYSSATMNVKATFTNKVTGEGVDMYLSETYSMRYCISADSKALVSMVVDVYLDDYHNSTLTHMVFDADLYFGNGRCAIKYNDLCVNGLSRDYTFLLGVWTDVETVDSVSTEFDLIEFDLTELFSTGFESDKMRLLLINSYLTQYGDEAFNKKDKNLVMKKEFLSEYVNEDFKIVNNTIGATFGGNGRYEDSDKLNMNIDFTNAISPKWEFCVKNGKYSVDIQVKDENSDSSWHTYTYNYLYNSEQSIEFTNINNTIIKFDEKMIVSFDEIFDEWVKN